jgi:AcrR family transcriptional regulator
MARKATSRTHNDEVADAVREARADARIRQLTRVATNVMEREGYHGMTMQNLARDAGVSVGLTYQYFKRKEDVLFAVVVDILDAYRQQIPEAMKPYTDPVQRLAAGFEAYCKIVNTKRHGAVLAYRETKTLDRARRDEIKNLELETTMLLAAVVKEGQDSGYFIAGDPILMAYDLIIFAHMWALKHWYFARRMSLKQYVRQQLQIILRSIVAPEKSTEYSELNLQK